VISAETIEKVASSGGRVARRRAENRKNLLKAAYELMSKQGVDGTSVKEVTSLADIGYGSFFNHFKTKEELVLCVLDCLIHNLGQRNDLATAHIKSDHPAEVINTSVRLVINELVSNQIWSWLLLRPDLLVERMRAGFHAFGMRDFNVAIEKERFIFEPDQLEIGWSALVWMLAGCAKDIQDGHIAPEDESTYSEIMMRAMGISITDAARLARQPLPEYQDLDIDFSFIQEL
jgi:AcrR family transcriptional regulator